MSKKVNPAAIGIFVTGAIAVAVVVSILVGSGKIFEQRVRFVAYFQSSANGLNEGADVLLGGVKVGSVENMHLQFDPESKKKVIPVIIELSADRIAELSAGSERSKDEILQADSMAKAIEDGLRARLKTRSPLTGQLYVDLDYLPEEEGYLFPGEPLQGLQQIPTTRNEIEQVLDSLAESFEKLDIGKLTSVVDNLNQLVTNLDDKIDELDLQSLGKDASGTLQAATGALESIDELVTGEKVNSTLASIREAASSMKALTSTIDGEEINATFERATASFETIDRAYASVDRASEKIAAVIAPDSKAVSQLNDALDKIEGAALAIEELADYLKRNPDALISGKK